MRISFGLESVKIDARGMADKLENDRTFWTFAASEWHRLYAPYVPFESGTLRDSVTIAPKTITHNAPYAHYQYTGDVYGPNYPITQNGVRVGFFSIPNRPKHKTGGKLKYKNPKAAAKWDQVAAATQAPKLVSSLQAYIDSGRLKLDG